MTSHRVASDMTIKVGDFRLARQLYSKDYYKLRHRAKVPIKWMPLESIHDGIFNEKTDVVCLIQHLCTHALKLPSVYSGHLV